MEELGASKLTKSSALSKSSEQLDQLRRYSAGRGGPNTDRSTIFLFAEVREGQWQDGQKKKHYITEAEATEPAIIQKNTQGHAQNQTKQKSLQNSESREDITVGSRNSSRATSPSPISPSWAKDHFESHGRVSDQFSSSQSTSEALSSPSSPKGLEVSETEIRSSSPISTQSKLPCENRPSLR